MSSLTNDATKWLIDRLGRPISYIDLPTKSKFSASIEVFDEENFTLFLDGIFIHPPDCSGKVRPPSTFQNLKYEFSISKGCDYVDLPDHQPCVVSTISNCFYLAINCYSRDKFNYFLETTLIIACDPFLDTATVFDYSILDFCKQFNLPLSTLTYVYSLSSIWSDWSSYIRYLNLTDDDPTFFNVDSHYFISVYNLIKQSEPVDCDDCISLQAGTYFTGNREVIRKSASTPGGGSYYGGDEGYRDLYKPYYSHICLPSPEPGTSIIPSEFNPVRVSIGDHVSISYSDVHTSGSIEDGPTTNTISGISVIIVTPAFDITTENQISIHENWYDGCNNGLSPQAISSTQVEQSTLVVGDNNFPWNNVSRSPVGQSAQYGYFHNCDGTPIFSHGYDIHVLSSTVLDSSGNKIYDVSPNTPLPPTDPPPFKDDDLVKVVINVVVVIVLLIPVVDAIGAGLVIGSTTATLSETAVVESVALADFVPSTTTAMTESIAQTYAAASRVRGAIQSVKVGVSGI